MLILSYLIDIISGRIKHWNKTNGLITVELFQRLEAWQEKEANSDKLADILKTFLALQYLLFKRFFTRGFLKHYFKQLGKSDFKNLNGIMLCFTCSWFIRSNPTLKARVLSGLEFLFSEWSKNELFEIENEFESATFKHLPLAFYYSFIEILEKKEIDLQTLENYDYRNWMGFYLAWAYMYKKALESF